MRKNIILAAGVKKLIPILWTGEETELAYTIRLSGKGAEVTMLVLLLGRQAQSVDVNVNIYHQKPNTKSLLLVKGALTGKSKVDFNGLVKIEPGARGSNAWLGARLLLLSNQAAGRVAPNLEIRENDVKAGHAATIGKVNDPELFYLMSRGLSKDTAINLIVEGFLQSMLVEFPKNLVNKAKQALSI